MLVPEANTGQLVRLLRAEYLVEARSLTKIQGVPFHASEIEEAILDALGVTPQPGMELQSPVEEAS